MKTLVIYAHPNTDGHNPVVLSQVEKQLKKRGDRYEVLDLYKMKYDPVLHEKEHYTAGNRAVSGENRKIQKKILDAEHLIFVYPLWWGSMPAILKGLVDRVFVSGFAFRYDGGRPIGLLKPRRATIFITSGGVKWFYKLFKAPRKAMVWGIFRFCGLKTRYVQIYNCMKLDAAKKKEIKKIVGKEFDRLE